MNDAQRRVTVAHLGNDDAQGAHVIDFLEVEILGAHLVPDAVDVLGPAVHLGLDAGLAHLVLQAGNGRLDEAFALDALLVELPGDALVGLRFDEAEGQVLDFPFHLPDTEAIGQRRIDFQALPRQVAPRRRVVVGEPAQRLRPRRQAQQHDANVVGHGQQHLAQNFRLRLEVRAPRRRPGALPRPLPARRLGQRSQALEPIQVVHQGRHRRAELRCQLVGPIRQVVAHRKQQRRQPRIGIEILARQLQRHAHRVRQNILAGTQSLAGIEPGHQLQRPVERGPRLFR